MDTSSLTTFGELAPEVAEAVATGERLEAQSNIPKVLGTGIYLEFPSDDNQKSTQILITPAGKDEKGNDVKVSFISRTISWWSPRSQWQIEFPENYFGYRSPSEPAPTQAELIAKAVDTIVGKLKREMYYRKGAMTLRGGKPIAFELTDVDFSDIQEWKVPASALRRIQKARLALGFTDKPYVKPAPKPTI